MVIDLDYDQAVSQGFDMLFKYISGSNKPGNRLFKISVIPFGGISDPWLFPEMDAI